MLPARTNLRRLSDGDFFLWATGIEDTFIADEWKGGGRTLDEYELTGHYSRVEEDISLMKSLGVPAARYGIPWYKVEPERDKWNWDFADKSIGQMQRRGIEPILDLVHYGTPEWLQDSFISEEYPDRVAEYAKTVAERYAGRIHWYTPLNEPRITAWYTGKLGWWPPYLRGWRGFLEVMINVCEGIVKTVHALRKVDPEIVCAHVDATDLYFTKDESLNGEVELRQQIVFLALDLITGRVRESHRLWPWLMKKKIDVERLQWFRDNAVSLDVLGINMYPMFTWKEVLKGPEGVRIRMRYAEGELVEELGRMYWNRYKVPMFISETASQGSVAKRMKWMRDSVRAVGNLRRDGIDIFGYTWWPMYSLVAWSYRQGDKPLHDYMLHMGLWDLDKQLNRNETPLVEEFKKLASKKKLEVAV